MATIVEIYQDLTNKWRVLADTGTETIMLKFDHVPTDTEVDNEVTKYTENKTQEETRRIEEQVNNIEAQIAALEAEIG